MPRWRLLGVENQRTGLQGKSTWKGRASNAALQQHFLQEDFGNYILYLLGMKQPKVPQQQGTLQDTCLSSRPGVAFACLFPRPLGKNSVAFLSLPLVPALLTKNWTGTHQCIMPYY